MQTLDPSLGLKVMILGLAGADPEQLRRLVPGMDTLQTFFAVDDGPGLDQAVSNLASILCQEALAIQVWKGPLGGLGHGEEGVWGLLVELPDLKETLCPQPQPEPCSVHCPKVSIQG